MPADWEPFTTTREYVAVRPTTDPIVPAHVTSALRSLHGASHGDDDGILTSGQADATIEMVLATTGADDGVSYQFGSDGVTTDQLERVLRRCFPAEYELRQTSTSLAEQLTGESSATAEQSALADRPIAAFEVQATEDRAGDWQTNLQSFTAFSEDEETTWPLATVIGTLASAECPALLQTLLEPKPDWTDEATDAIEAYHWPQKSVLGSVVAELFGLGGPESTERYDRDEIPPANQTRIEEIEATNSHQSFHVNVRALTAGTDTTPPDVVLDDLDGAFTDVGKTTYQLTSKQYAPGSTGTSMLADAIATRSMRGVARSRRLERTLDISLPFSTNTHPRIVADPTTAGSFCFVGGASLSPAAARAIETRPGERTGLTRPPDSVLEPYRVPGYVLGTPQTSDHEYDPEPIAVPPTLQRRHQLVAGQTGSGKSIWGVLALLANQEATDGATIVFESKDGQMADDYERAHYAKYETLENVYRFDAAEQLPATPFFDVTRQQDSGIARSQAVEDVADHTEELLKAIIGVDQYNRALTSSNVIQALVKALFDPVHGSDQFTLADLQEALRRFGRTGHAPPVATESLQSELQRIADNSDDTFTEIIGGATRRIAQAALDTRVAPLFNYAPASDDASQAMPFDWRSKLDEDCVIIIDTSELRQDPQQIVTLGILSQLWTALHRREYERAQTGRREDPPLVNIHVEEAADVAASGILADMLQKGRSYGCSVTLSLQYPRQLERANEATYEEAMNNIGTVITGRVEHDRPLAERLATDDMPPGAVANRLRGLAPGEWLVSLPATFGAEPPRPFQVDSLPLPPGHPDGPDPLTPPQRATFTAAQTQLQERSRRYGIPVAGLSTAIATTSDGAAKTDVQSTATTADTDQAADYPTIDTTLPVTRRLPADIDYHAPSSSLVCTTCETRHGRRLPELLAAIECHGDLDDIDRAAIPTVHVGLTLSPGERSTLEYSDAQLIFLQLVYNAHQQRYDTEWEYDIVHDGMDCLRAYAGLSDDEFERLILDELLAVDGDHPHVLYTVTPEGRDIIDAAHREGRAHGDGVGDLSESSMHVMMVETIRRAFTTEFVEEPSHAGAEVQTYYPVDDGRLDIAVLDDEGEVVVTAEAERSNHDTLQAVPADYDKMAACDPDQAFWIVEGRSEGHEVIQALNNPRNGSPRVEKTYSESYALTRVAIDEPGFTDIFTIGSFRNHFLKE